jgi:tetratricopeptide (TPR) repeat protein
MLALPDVTLCCIDTANHALALRALARSCAGIRFAHARFLTHGLPGAVEVPPGIDVVEIQPIASREAYSAFVLKSLLPYVHTSHVLLIQWDGYVVNPSAWTPDFLACDYIGAKWFWYDDGMRVGNGGFSLRSWRLLEALQDARIGVGEAEDTTIGRIARPLLESAHGIRYADDALADRFSFEAAYPIGMPFGFHGLFNFCRTVPPHEIAALAATFSDAIAQSPQLLQLMRNCTAMQQWQAVQAIAQRMLLAAPDTAEAAATLERARAALAQPPVVGRNEPCPCGSGKKYKQCHGALQSASAAAAPAAPDADALVRTGMTAHQQGQLDAAERSYRNALAAAPDHPVATHFLGVLHYQKNELAQALPLLEAAAAAKPDEPEFHNNLGLALAAGDRVDEALSAYRRALQLKPQHATAWNNLGLALQAQNRVEEAIDAYRQALQHAPQFGQAHWNLALALLVVGRFREGWKEYEWRLALQELGGRTTFDPTRRWDGRIAAGTTLLLTAEQGLGDAVQFVRYARTLAERGMRVAVQAPAPLRTLLATAPGVAAVCAPGDALPAHDAHLPLLSLPGVLGIDAATPPEPTRYLEADTTLREAVRRELPRGTRIGICWQGNRGHSNDRRRSLPYAALAPLLRMPDIAWISLQKDSAAGPPLVELPFRNDLDAIAALIAELDLVLTVDTSIAHLAAALGRPTWILLPFAPDWRWGLAGDTTPWYPTARLIRQPAIGDWTSVVADVAQALGMRRARPGIA